MKSAAHNGLADAKAAALAVLDAMKAPVVAINDIGDIRFANKAWKKFEEANTQGATPKGGYLNRCKTVVGIDEDNLPLLSLAIDSLFIAGGEDLCIEMPFRVPSRKGWYRIRIALLELEGEQLAAVFHSDITGHKNTLERLRINEEQLAGQAQVMEFIKDALIVVDPNLIIQTWNPGAQRIYGYTPAETIGRHVRMLMPEGEIQNIQRESWEQLNEIGYCEIEGYRRKKNGSRFYAQISLSLLKNADGVVSGIVGYTMDTTEKRHIAEELQASLRQLEDALQTANKLSIEARTANEAKSEFLANMSHEIRTPMNGVIGMTELLVGTDLNEEQREYATTIQSSANALLKVLNDILDFSKIEAGKMSIEAQPFDLRQTFEAVTDLLTPQSQAKGLQLVLDVPSDSPTVVVGDELRVRQILTNLVGNAVKFTPEGDVVVGITHLGTTQENVRLRLWVRDQGPGIDAERQEAIFDSFTQGDSSTTRKHGGTGLGLAICKNLCQLMGGEIGVDSTLGHGATFWVEIELPSISVEHLRRDPHPFKGRRMLVLDPSEAVRKVIVEAIEGWGASCESAACVEDVLARSSKTPLDVVICSDSLDARLFSQSRLVEMYPLGMKPSPNAPYAGVLTKPIKLASLRRLLEQLLDSSGARDTDLKQAA